MNRTPKVRLAGLLFALSIAFSACSTVQPQGPLTLRMDGYMIPVNQGHKSLPQEKFNIKYDSSTNYVRQVESKGRVEKITEDVSLGWEINRLEANQEWIQFRLYISNPAKIVHRVTYYQKCDGKVVQQLAEPNDSIADFRNHFCRFPVLKNGKVVEIGARVDLYQERNVYATIVADGFRYISSGDVNTKPGTEKGGESEK